MTIEIPKGLYALLGVLFVVVAAAVPLSLLWRRRAATPEPAPLPSRNESAELADIMDAFEAEVAATHAGISEDADQRVRELARQRNR